MRGPSKMRVHDARVSNVVWECIFFDFEGGKVTDGPPINRIDPVQSIGASIELACGSGGSPARLRIRGAETCL